MRITKNLDFVSTCMQLSNKKESRGIEMTDCNSGRMTLEMTQGCHLQLARRPSCLGDWPSSLSQGVDIFPLILASLTSFLSLDRMLGNISAVRLPRVANWMLQRYRTVVLFTGSVIQFIPTFSKFRQRCLQSWRCSGMLIRKQKFKSSKKN